MKKYLIYMIITVLCFSFALSGCVSKEKPGEKYEKYDYTPKHESTNNVLKFYSSDKTLDAFLNDFHERHMRYTENKIHEFPVGLGGPSWKGWESQIGSFWDATHQTLADPTQSQTGTKDSVLKWLKTPIQDRQGYIWTDNGVGSSINTWGMGWQFPTYKESGFMSTGFEFSGETSGFTTSSNNTLSANGEFVELETKVAANEIYIESPEVTINTKHAPFISLNWFFENLRPNQQFEDVYIYFTTANSPNYSDDKRMSLSKDALIVNESYKTTTSANAKQAIIPTWFPLYLNSNWSTDQTVKKIKIVVKATPQNTLAGKLGLDFIRCEYDDRLANSPGDYIEAAWNMLKYSQSEEHLKAFLPKARQAFLFYTKVLNGDSGLISHNYFVGHEATGSTQSGEGIGNGYWDVVSFASENLYNNLKYHKALQSMVAIEEMAQNLEVVLDAPVAILGRDLREKHTFNYSAQQINDLLNKCTTRMNEKFWNAEKGRYILGYYPSGEEQDNGNLEFNLTAVTQGIASPDKAKLIMQWVTGEREVTWKDSKGRIKKDDAVKEDIYYYEFAPRFTTKNNLFDYIWIYNNGIWDTGVQNGGAVLQTSYYDLLARSNVLGADNAYERLKGIQKWYNKIQNAGGEGDQFYREYYRSTNISPQGGGTSGTVGLDVEFLEAALLFVAVPDAFFGLNANSSGQLCVAPTLPSSLQYWKMENLTFDGSYYDLSIGKYFVTLSGIRDGAQGRTVNVQFAKPGFDFKVLYNGSEIEYQIKDEKVCVNVPFSEGKVEIVG